MATFKAILKPKPKLDGTHLVMIRIIANRKPTYLSANIYVKKSDWNDKGNYEKGNWIRSTNTMFAVYNNAIKAKIQELQKTVLESENTGSDLSSKAIKNKLKPEKSQSFIQYYEKQLLYIQKTQQHRTFEKYQVTLNKLKALNREIYFSDLTIEFIRDLEALFLQTTKINTVAKNLQNVAHIIKLAVQDELIEYAKDPFIKFKIKHEKTNVIRFNIDEIKQIESIELDSSQKIFHARNIFILQFYCAGVRIADMLLLKHKNIDGNRLTYIMSKKPYKPKSILLLPGAIKIFSLYQGNPNDYVFPFLKNDVDYSNYIFMEKQIESKTSLINKLLREIGRAHV